MRYVAAVGLMCLSSSALAGLVTTPASEAKVIAEKLTMLDKMQLCRDSFIAQRNAAIVAGRSGANWEILGKMLDNAAQTLIACDANARQQFNLNTLPTYGVE